MLGRWEAFLTPNLLAVTQGSVGRQFLTTPPENPSAFEQSLVSTAWGRLPQMTVDSRYGFTIGNPARFGPGGYPDEHLYEGQEQLSWVRGAMLIKAGFDFRHNNDATGFLRNQTGTYDYASVENFASDALAFAAFGLNGQLNPMDQHNCDQTGKVWRDSAGTLHGLGYLPCYSSYTQTMGPDKLVAEHQRLGWLCHLAMAAEKDDRRFAGNALGIGAEPTAHSRCSTTRSASDGENAEPRWAVGAARQRCLGRRREPLARAALRIWDVFWTHAECDVRDRTHADRLAQRRFEFLYAAHRQFERWRRSAVPLRARRRTSLDSQTGCGRVRTRFSQRRSASSRRFS
jgi:hypothetical protein